MHELIPGPRGAHRPTSHSADQPGPRVGGRHRKPAPPLPGAAVLTTGAFALVPLALSTGTAAAAEPAPSLAPAPTVDWTPIIKCESGHNPKAQNSSSTASGLFQFLDSSWKAYGGGKYSARAKDATVAQQTEVAEAAFRRSGLTPWKASQHCWGGKVNTKAAPKTLPEPAKPVIREVSLPISPAAPAPRPAAPAPAALPTPVPAAVPTAGPTAGPTAVPAGLTGVALPGLPLPAQLVPAAERYTVKPGDSLVKIASERGISWQSLWEANKGSVARPSLLHPGEQLQLPTAPGRP